MNMPQKHQELFFNLKKKLICGFASGFFTGMIFGIPEYMKVVKQLPINQISMIDFLKDPKNIKGMIRGIISFPVLVAFVAGAQFTVNDQIGKSFGKFPGILASAISGATFLVVGDHYMLRQKLLGSNFIESSRYLLDKKAFFIGFKAITMRQVIFMTNVIYAGPILGKYLKSIIEKPSVQATKHTEIDHNWNFIGRTLMGIIATYISQPFDVLSRRQQITFSNENKKEGLRSAMSSLKDGYRKVNPKMAMKDLYKHPLIAGISCRMWLGTFGGAVIKGLYDYFEQQYDTFSFLEKH